MQRPSAPAATKVPRLCGAAAFGRPLGAPPVARADWFSLHHAPAAEGSAALMLGMLVPKRHAKRAVTRNSVRRQIVVWFSRWRQSQALQGHYVVRLKHTLPLAQFPSADSKALREALRAQLQLLAERMRWVSQS